MMVCPENHKIGVLKLHLDHTIGNDGKRMLVLSFWKYIKKLSYVLKVLVSYGVVIFMLSWKPKQGQN